MARKPRNQWTPLDYFQRFRRKCKALRLHYGNIDNRRRRLITLVQEVAGGDIMYVKNNAEMRQMIALGTSPLKVDNNVKIPKALPDEITFTDELQALPKFQGVLFVGHEVDQQLVEEYRIKYPVVFIVLNVEIVDD